jgi:hypothetical protein
MKPKFGDNAYAGDYSARAERIRELFVAGTTVAAHTEYCIDQELWTAAEMRAKATGGCRNEVRAALGAIMGNGLPFAGQTTERDEEAKAPIWRQIEFWEKPDYYLNNRAYIDRGGDNVGVGNRIASDCWRRYGDGPPQYAVVEVAEAAFDD